ncbi:hypothetical protein [Clostridium culturomicium]|uniref:hypothetical protein n=1 Tax=Clostridium culturomicium TaxID=1499683 RepID=UPI00058EA356|nr:hypothetical protein [Clostridium culturomicium]
MKKGKKIIAIGLFLCCIMSSNIVAFANDSLTVTPNNNMYSANDGSIDINNPDASTIISEVMTFDELAEDMAKTKNITKEKAESLIIKSRLNASTIRDENGRLSEDILVSAERATYRTITQYVAAEVTSYKPSIKFYCQTDEWPGSSFRAIEKILDVTLNTISGSVSKVFSGKIFTHLETANRIFYRISGHFYNTGSSTVSGGAELNLGESATLSFSVSSTTSYFSAIYREGYTYF